VSHGASRRRPIPPVAVTSANGIQSGKSRRNRYTGYTQIILKFLEQPVAFGRLGRA
jgi:hypothetical protein